MASQLSLAGRRLPLDLFFLQDTSASMRAYVAGFDRGTQQLVDDLTAAGIDVAAGVGEFYGLDLRYRRLRDIGDLLLDREILEGAELAGVLGGSSPAATPKLLS